MHLPVPTQTPATSQPRPGPLHAPARLLAKACPRFYSAHVKVCNKYSGEASAFFFAREGTSRRVLQAGGTNTSPGSLAHCAQRERLGRDVDSESILASVMTFQITFPLNMTHSFCATFCNESSKQSVLPWAQSTPALQCADGNWIAKIAETDPRETLGSPPGVTVGGHCDRSLALR